jgi:hypothetical protein
LPGADKETLDGMQAGKLSYPDCLRPFGSPMASSTAAFGMVAESRDIDLSDF